MMDGFLFNYSLPVGHSFSHAPLANRSKAKVTGIQRKAANERERKRMNSINKGFDILRDRLPVDSTDRKLSKVDTLKYAMRYIEQLQKLLEEPKEQTSQTKLLLESNGGENPPSVIMVSWRKVPERYGTAHPSPIGPIVYQKDVWFPSK